MHARLLRKRLLDVTRMVVTPPPRGLVGTLTRARMWTPGLDLAILLRTVWTNLVGKRQGSPPLPPGRA